MCVCVCVRERDAPAVCSFRGHDVRKQQLCERPQVQQLIFAAPQGHMQIGTVFG